MLRIGDRVVVTHRVEKEEGWYNTWVVGMDKAIGNIFTIRSASNQGIGLVEHHCLFPLGCLRKYNPDIQEPDVDF